MFDDGWRPSIDQVLDDFARDGAVARHPASSGRFAATRTRLVAYLATDAQHALHRDERALLLSEREFAPEGAFSRIFGPEVLLAALPGFLEPGWLPRQLFDARFQIRFVELLCDWLVARRLVRRRAVGCQVGDVRDAARSARAAIRTVQRRDEGPGPATAARQAGQGG
jgi:hypothetical protein